MNTKMTRHRAEVYAAEFESMEKSDTSAVTLTGSPFWSRKDIRLKSFRSSNL